MLAVGTHRAGAAVLQLPAVAGVFKIDKLSVRREGRTPNLSADVRQIAFVLQLHHFTGLQVCLSTVKRHRVKPLFQLLLAKRKSCVGCHNA